MLHLDAAGIRRNADLLQVDVDASAKILVDLQLVVRLPEVEGADVADGHQGVAPRRLGIGENARVQVKVVVGLRLVDVTGAATRHGLELDQLVADLRRERACGDVQLLRRQRGEAAFVVGELLHGVAPSVSSRSLGRNGRGAESASV